MTLVVLGLRPSLHAAARKMEHLPVSLAALYDKLRRTEPAVLRGLVQGSAQRLMPVAASFVGEPSLAGWRLRIVDGNHLPASERRLRPRRGHRGAALPGHSLVVYDPDLGLVCDVVACEDAHASERVGVQPLVDGAQRGELWIADRYFCTQASFIVREHARHPRLSAQGTWSDGVVIDTGHLREQTIEIQSPHEAAAQPAAALVWRRIEIALDTPTEAGETQLRLWSNLPATVDATTIAALYRKRWRIGGMFQRLESVLHSEIKSLGHPRAALLGFTVAVLAYNVLALLQRAVEHAHRTRHPSLDVSSYHLAEHVKSGYEDMLIALPPEHWPSPADRSPLQLAAYLLTLVQRISPRQVATSKRAPKVDKPKGFVEGSVARAHVSTARVLKESKRKRP